MDRERFLIERPAPRRRPASTADRRDPPGPLPSRDPEPRPPAAPTGAPASGDPRGSWPGSARSPHGAPDPETDFGVAAVEGPAQSGTQILLFPAQPALPGTQRGATKPALLARPGRAARANAAVARRRRRARDQSLDGERSNDLQHAEASAPVLVLGLPDEALVGQRSEAVERVEAQLVARVGHLFGRFERPSSRERREPGEQTPLRRVEQLVAPVDRPLRVRCRAGLSRAPLPAPAGAVRGGRGSPRGSGP